MLPSIVEKYGFTPGRGVVVYDPATMTAMTAVSLATTAAGTAISAGGTIAGGNAQKATADYTATQIRQNEGGAIASSQRQMFDTQQKTRMAISSVAAQSGANGTNAGVGSPAATTSAIASRGSYLAAVDLFRGENQATGLENQARGVLFTGNVAKEGADVAALGTIAGGAGQMTANYGRARYMNAMFPGSY